ncbi:hypothetical protein Tco_1409157 [Tanacetum coccineum]
MVNTRTDAELAAAVQAAVDAMLPQIREQVREEYRTGGFRFRGDAFGFVEGPICRPKEEWRGSANFDLWAAFKEFSGFLGHAVGTAEEQAKNFRWGLHKSILDHVMCIQFTDVAQVADAARNLENPS